MAVWPDSWNAKYPNGPVQIAEYWREWAPDFFTAVTAHTKDFVQYATKEMRVYWAVGTGDVAKQVMEILAILARVLDNLKVDTSGFK